MFNFDASGMADFKLAGTVNISVSDSFTYLTYLQFYPAISADTYTSLSSGAANWTTTQLANINLITSSYAQFINVNFSPVSNYAGYTPANVGSLSDINISLIYRTDWPYAGESALATDTSFIYAYSRGDIVLNVNGFGASGLSNDYTLGATSYGFHTLMHEIGHSLGLSHPHSAYNNGSPVITADTPRRLRSALTSWGLSLPPRQTCIRNIFPSCLMTINGRYRVLIPTPRHR